MKYLTKMYFRRIASQIKQYSGGGDDGKTWKTSLGNVKDTLDTVDKVAKIAGAPGMTPDSIANLILEKTNLLNEGNMSPEQKEALKAEIQKLTELLEKLKK